MKKIGIAVLSLMFLGVAYVGAVEIDFDGKSDIQDIKKSGGFTMPEGFSDIEYNIPVPSREVNYEKDLMKETFIPTRLPVFTVAEIKTMNKSIESAIASVKLHNQGDSLVYSFECLRKYGTPKEKFDFVYGKSNLPYKFPKNCVMKLKLAQNKGVIDDGLQWLCESYNDVIEYLSCHKGPDGEEVCDVKLRTILRQSCDWG